MSDRNATDSCDTGLESLYDTFAWQIVIFPITAYQYAIWRAQWILRYWIRKEEYDEEAKLYLIRKNMKMSEEQFHVRVSALDHIL